MRKFSKFVSILLIGSLLFSVSACNKNGGKSNEETYTFPNTVETVARGTHTDRTTAAEGYVVRNQASSYSIVIPADASNELRMTASELSDIVADVTGARLTVITDEGLSFDKDATYLSLGETSLASGAEIDLGEEFLLDGYRIVTRGKTVFLCGVSDAGTQYAADDWLYRTLGVDWVHPDWYSFDETAGDIRLENYDVTEIPDFARRSAASYRTSAYRLRHWRQQPYASAEVMVGEWKEWVHNSTYWFMQYDENGNEIRDAENSIRNHNEWVANNKPLNENHDLNALCFNANGDQTSRVLMLEVALDKIKKAFAKGVQGKFIPFSIEDNDLACECEACIALEERYHAYSAGAILFINDLAKATREWLATDDGAPYRNKEYMFTWLAYTSAWECPDNIELDEDVTVWIAPINMDYTKSVYDPANASYKEQMDKWFALAGDKPVLTWFYNTNFHYYCATYDDFDTIPDLYRYMADKNVYNLWAQGQGQSREFTGFYTYKLYLTAKLEWNVNEDVNALKLRWFKGYFGDAWETMYAWFENIEAWWSYCRTFEEPYGGTRSLYQNMIDEKFHPRYVLQNWLNYAEQAYRDIEPLEAVDADAYAVYEERITRERLSPIYFMMEIYGSTMSESELKELRKTFYNDAVRTRFDNVKEWNGTIAEYTVGWDL